MNLPVYIKYKAYNYLQPLFPCASIFSLIWAKQCLLSQTLVKTFASSKLTELNIFFSLMWHSLEIASLLILINIMHSCKHVKAMIKFERNNTEEWHHMIWNGKSLQTMNSKSRHCIHVHVSLKDGRRLIWNVKLQFCCASCSTHRTKLRPIA